MCTFVSTHFTNSPLATNYIVSSALEYKNMDLMAR